jgi:hypothetical protein
MHRLPDRILNKIEFEPNTGCWIWNAASNNKGYGKIWWNGKLCEAHRTVYELLIGSIPSGLECDHLCRVPCCVNPAHIEPVTASVNSFRGKNSALLDLSVHNNGRKTHCKRGHLLSGPNVLFSEWEDGSVHRSCRICKREQFKEWYQRNRHRVLMRLRKLSDCPSTVAVPQSTTLE